MLLLKTLKSKWESWDSERTRKNAESIFSVSERDGEIWFYCHGTPLFPCKFVNLTTEEEIVCFLKHMRAFYTESEGHAEGKD